MTEEDLRAKIGKLEVETDQKEHEIIQYLEKIEQLEDTIMRLELLIPDESNKKRKKSKDSKSSYTIVFLFSSSISIIFKGYLVFNPKIFLWRKAYRNKFFGPIKIEIMINGIYKGGKVTRSNNITELINMPTPMLNKSEG
ncbi:unnamed protein product, partial [marine sediment metagenome]